MQKLLEVNLEIDSLNQNLELILVDNEEYELTSIDQNEADFNILLDINQTEGYTLDVINDDFSYIVDPVIEIVNSIEGEVYTGPAEIIPSQETQILNTTNKVLLKDIIVKPIPSNYGLITWNGSTLTVS